MKRFVLTYRARVDLQNIWNYIAEESFDAADKVLENIKAEISGLVDFPGKGHTRQDVRDQRLRFWRVHSYLIAYLPETKPLQIIRVVSGYRDLQKLFVKR